MEKCNQHILTALELSRSLLSLADSGQLDADDDTCHLLYAVIRDCGYKVRKQAEIERDKHVAQGRWEGVLAEGGGKPP